jgi:hypothetical protein
VARPSLQSIRGAGRSALDASAVFAEQAATAANPDGSVYTLPVTSLFAEMVGQGRFFLASTGKLALAAAGNARATFANPAGSGRNIYLARIASLASAGPAWATVLINPTAGLPATAARRHLNALVSGADTQGVGVMKADVNLTTPLSGGTDTGVVIGIPAGSRVALDLPPFVLLPGQTLGFNLPFTGAADAVMSLYWAEVNA